MFVNIFQPLSGWTDLPAELPFPLCHRFDADILNANDIIAVCEVASLLMQEIPALIGHFLMENSYTLPLFFSVMTFFLLLG